MDKAWADPFGRGGGIMTNLADMEALERFRRGGAAGERDHARGLS